MSDEPCVCGTDFTCLADIHGCYICQPGNPAAAVEGCESCDREYWARVLAAEAVSEPIPLSPGSVSCERCDWSHESWSETGLLVAWTTHCRDHAAHPDYREEWKP